MSELKLDPIVVLDQLSKAVDAAHYLINQLKSEIQIQEKIITAGVSCNNKLLDVKSAAQYLGCKEHQIRQLYMQRNINYCKLGGRVMVYKDELDIYIEASREISSKEIRSNSHNTKIN